MRKRDGGLNSDAETTECAVCLQDGVNDAVTASTVLFFPLGCLHAARLDTLRCLQAPTLLIPRSGQQMIAAAQKAVLGGSRSETGRCPRRRRVPARPHGLGSVKLAMHLKIISK